MHWTTWAFEPARAGQQASQRMPCALAGLAHQPSQLMRFFMAGDMQPSADGWVFSQIDLKICCNAHILPFNLKTPATGAGVVGCRRTIEGGRSQALNPLVCDSHASGRCRTDRAGCAESRKPAEQRQISRGSVCRVEPSQPSPSSAVALCRVCRSSGPAFKRFNAGYRAPRLSSATASGVHFLFTFAAPFAHPAHPGCHLACLTSAGHGPCHTEPSPGQRAHHELVHPHWRQLAR